AYWFGNALPILAVYDGEWHHYAYEAAGDPFFSGTADYRVRITAPAGLSVYATGEEQRSISDDAGADIAVTDIAAPQVRDFAFALSGSHRTIQAETVNGIAVHLHYRKSSDVRAEEALQQAASMIEHMETRVGAFPHSELDIFENEMFVTGMEYPGIVFVRSD